MKEIEQRKVELLAPAGSYETFLAVIEAGADAVYLGGNQFGARAFANNFSEDELLRAIDYAHMQGRQVYLTVNTLFKEKELEEQLYNYLLPYYKQGLDAVIVQDLGAFSLIKNEFPKLDIHASTQMTITGCDGAKYLKKLGATRVVTARELSLLEIRNIHEQVDIEIESFVHGALCYCFSGQCLFSSMLGGRSGNRGRCAQPCRLPYEVYEQNGKKKSQKGEFVLSPKDLNTIALIPQIIESGVYSFKIEGRMKQAEYAAGVVSVYREYLNRYFAAPQDYRVTEQDYQKLLHLGNRSGFTDGYYTRWNGSDMITFGKPNHSKADEDLQSQVRQNFLSIERKEKIKGFLKLKKDFPAILELYCDRVKVQQEGECVQAALKQPLSREKVETSIKKTGGTPFIFETLEIEMEEDVFLPVQTLNQLRREALERLQEEITAQWRRTEVRDKQIQMCSKCEKKDTLDRENLAVSVENRIQIPAVLSFSAVDDIYFDSSCYDRDNFFRALSEDVRRAQEAGKKAYYIFPAIFRKKAAEFYLEHLEEFCSMGLDGVVVKSYDAAAFVRTYLGGEINVILDYNLYGWNHRAMTCLEEFMPLRDTVPLELNRKELFERSNQNSEILIYGRIPLMLSAQCVHANTEKCDAKKTVTYLKDRYGKNFPVKNNCFECYNVIYNTAPLVLFGFHDDFRRMQMAGYRIAFTIENEQEIRSVIDIYEQTFATGKKRVTELLLNGSYTNGHYKRGVE